MTQFFTLGLINLWLLSYKKQVIRIFYLDEWPFFNDKEVKNNDKAVDACFSISDSFTDIKVAG